MWAPYLQRRKVLFSFAPDKSLFLSSTAGSPLSLPTKIAIGATITLIVLAAVIVPSVYFSLASRSLLFDFDPLLDLYIRPLSTLITIMIDCRIPLIHLFVYRTIENIFFFDGYELDLSFVL